MGASARIKLEGIMHEGSAQSFGSSREEYGMPVLVSAYPERTILGKPHPDRAKQFKPFAALKGYEDLVAQQIRKASASRDFTEPEDPC
ncbi:hypothetical protein [Adlercreutzia murintestinalis]|uniref:hypothetical protein n=1 Tax=Adlercreutzia murintestinalis TaxID=2941325 RepID=UPI00203FEB0B|nr:hypothetical protein [Adlercreutzia murintestinalis]